MAAHAVYGSCGRAERDERIHVGRAVGKRLEAHTEELEVHEDDGQQQQQLGKRRTRCMFSSPKKTPGSGQPNICPIDR